MYCHKCGKMLADDAGFCHNCGTKVKREDMVSQRNKEK